MRKIYYFCMVSLSLLFAACTPSGGGDEKAATYLNVTPNEIVFSANADNSFIVDCDASWIITASQEIRLSAREGTAGKTTVKVLDMPSPMTTSLLVETPSNSNLYVIVKLTRNTEGGGNNGGDALVAADLLFRRKYGDGRKGRVPIGIDHHQRLLQSIARLRLRDQIVREIAARRGGG